jgi:hypothetical protein
MCFNTSRASGPTRSSPAWPPLLISFQEGEAEDERAGAEGGISEAVRRSQEEMRDAVERGGLEIVSWHGFEGREADWVLLIAYRP